MEPAQQKSALRLPQQWQQCQSKQDVAVQHHQLHKEIQALHVSCHIHPPVWLCNVEPACWLWTKDQSFRNTCLRKLRRIPNLEHKTDDWVQRKINFLVSPQEPLLATHQKTEICMVRACHTLRQPLQKPSFRAPWRVRDAVVGRGNPGWTTSKSGHHCPCQSCSERPPAEKIKRRPLLNWPSCSPDEPFDQWTVLNWTELITLLKPPIVPLFTISILARMWWHAKHRPKQKAFTGNISTESSGNNLFTGFVREGSFFVSKRNGQWKGRLFFQLLI